MNWLRAGCETSGLVADSVRLGSSTNNESRTAGGHKGPDSEHFKENISSQQSEVSSNCHLYLAILTRMQPVWPDKFNEIQYNNPKGK